MFWNLKLKLLFVLALIAACFADQTSEVDTDESIKFDPNPVVFRVKNVRLSEVEIELPEPRLKKDEPWARLSKPGAQENWRLFSVEETYHLEMVVGPEVNQSVLLTRNVDPDDKSEMLRYASSSLQPDDGCYELNTQMIRTQLLVYLYVTPTCQRDTHVTIKWWRWSLMSHERLLPLKAITSQKGDLWVYSNRYRWPLLTTPYQPAVLLSYQGTLVGTSHQTLPQHGLIGGSRLPFMRLSGEPTFFNVSAEAIDTNLYMRTLVPCRILERGAKGQTTLCGKRFPILPDTTATFINLHQIMFSQFEFSVQQPIRCSGAVFELLVRAYRLETARDFVLLKAPAECLSLVERLTIYTNWIWYSFPCFRYFSFYLINVLLMLMVECHSNVSDFPCERLILLCAVLFFSTRWLLYLLDDDYHQYELQKATVIHACRREAGISNSGLYLSPNLAIPFVFLSIPIVFYLKRISKDVALLLTCKMKDEQTPPCEKKINHKQLESIEISSKIIDVEYKPIDI